MAPEDLIKATEGIIKGKKQGEQADRLIKSYQRLRRFFPEEKRADLAEGFVSFCQGRIGEKRFRQLAEILGGARKKQRKKSFRRRNPDVFSSGHISQGRHRCFDQDHLAVCGNRKRLLL